MAKQETKRKNTKVQEGEVISKKTKPASAASEGPKPYVFKPMAGFWLLYLLAYIGVITTLDGRDYDSLPERIFWGVITLGLIIGIQKHWPAMRQIMANRRARRGR